MGTVHSEAWYQSERRKKNQQKKIHLCFLKTNDFKGIESH